MKQYRECVTTLDSLVAKLEINEKNLIKSLANKSEEVISNQKAYIQMLIDTFKNRGKANEQIGNFEEASDDYNKLIGNTQLQSIINEGEYNHHQL